MKIKKNLSRLLAGAAIFTAGFTGTGAVAFAVPAETSGSVNFRVGPSTSYSIISKLTQGTMIDVLSHTYSWSKVQVGDTKGYLSTKYISFTTEGKITGRVNLRSKGSSSGTILTKIPAGETVKVLAGPVYNWYKVVWGQYTGYIYGNYVEIIPESTVKESPLVNGQYSVITTLPKYTTAEDAKNGTGSVGTFSAGTYYIYSQSDGMLNISTSQSTSGGWINPSANTDKPAATSVEYPGYTPMTWTVSFYTDLPTENGGWTVTALGTELRYGVLASNYWPLRSKVILPDWGDFTVEDRGGSSFDSKYRLDMLIARNSGESNTEYLNRVNNMGLKTISGYIQTP